MLTVERAKQKLFWGGLIAFDMEDGYGIFEYSLEENRLYLTIVNEKNGESRVYCHNDIDKLNDLVKEMGLELYEVREDGEFLERVE